MCADAQTWAKLLRVAAAGLRPGAPGLPRRPGGGDSDAFSRGTRLTGVSFGPSWDLQESTTDAEKPWSQG